MTSIPTSLRIAIAFVFALWIVGLTALAFGAPGEIVVVTAALGTVGALIEWSSHRQDGHGPDRLEDSQRGHPLRMASPFAGRRRCAAPQDEGPGCGGNRAAHVAPPPKAPLFRPFSRKH